jgi:hypothetical protein
MVAKVARVSQDVYPETLTCDLAIQKRCGCLLFRARKNHFSLTLSHLEALAQRKRRGYKEGKCNRCNRMHTASACIALHASATMFVESS